MGIDFYPGGRDTEAAERKARAMGLAAEVIRQLGRAREALASPEAPAIHHGYLAAAVALTSLRDQVDASGVCPDRPHPAAYEGSVSRESVILALHEDAALLVDLYAFSVNGTGFEVARLERVLGMAAANADLLLRTRALRPERLEDLRRHLGIRGKEAGNGRRDPAVPPAKR
ncbi:MAG: hypothetical protein RLZZ324_83 [Candidatus Parcubacteria bacterium]|jgi:hypothetical protein